MKLGQYFKDKLGCPLYLYAGVGGALTPDDVELESGCGVDCKTAVDQMVTYIALNPNRTHPDVRKGLLDSLRAEIEIYFYG
jgi:hypothetical protein